MKNTTPSMKTLIGWPSFRCRLILLILTLAGCTLLPGAQAVNPPPDGGYPNFTTAEGENALLNLTIGSGNTAVGSFSLESLSTGSFNTAVGAGTLLFNNADSNTAVGAAALLFNTSGTENTASGTAALENNTTGNSNAATGDSALFSNSTGSENTANGAGALSSNITGNSNTAVGESALLNNTAGDSNTVIGVDALAENTTGSGNIALGFGAGGNITTASNVICIAALGNNVDDSCFIGNIFGATSSGGTAVFINSNGRLGTATSSRRFKEEIKPMESVSESILALKPVTFRYKRGIDPEAIPQFGLVAEEVEAVNPDLVVRDKEGKPQTVRYEAINAMLLNEFLKEHRKLQEQAATISQLRSTVENQIAANAQQQRQIETLTAGLQKVTARIEASQTAPQVVENN
jgi:Chaperone of endosialidase